MRLSDPSDLELRRQSLGMNECGVAMRPGAIDVSDGWVGSEMGGFRDG